MLDTIFDVADLLGRPELSWDPPAEVPARVLITGGGGDLARGLGRRLASRGVQLALLDHDDNALLDACTDLRGHGAEDVVPLLGSVLDDEWLNQRVAAFAPDWVIHAAVLKAAPLLEADPVAAFRTNAASVYAVAAAAARAGATRFHLPTSNEAYRPTANFGVSKLLGEWFARQAAADFPSLAVSSIRFGAVLLSTGSVGETFQLRAWQGSPLVVLSPRLERFFFSLAEASDCCLATMGANLPSGTLLQLDLPPALRLVDLAERLIARSGSTSRLVVTDDLRPGDFEQPPGIEQMVGLTPGPVEHTFTVAEDWDEIGRWTRAALAADRARDSDGLAAAFRALRHPEPGPASR